LDRSNGAHFGETSPGLGSVRDAIEDCLAAVELISGACPANSPDQANVDFEPIEKIEQVETHFAVLPRVKSGPIADTEDACRRIVEASAYLRRNDATSPIPYLIVRALQAGRIYQAADRCRTSQFEAPLSDTRRNLLRLASAGDWEELLEQAELVLGRPEG